jgi:hypothetical protein
MKQIEELYYMLGRLEGLKAKTAIKVEELEFARSILEQNQYFRDDDREVEFESNSTSYIDFSDDDTVIMGDPRHDSDENPWIDVFGEGEEAEDAYRNTE